MTSRVRPFSILDRRRFLAWAGAGGVASALGSFLQSPANAGNAPAPGVPQAPRLLGEYGFLSSAVLGPQPEPAIRARIATMARDFGIREFQFYDWFADYSTPVAGDQWRDPYFRRAEISRRTIQTSIDEVHRQGGRAWAYVQSVGAEERDLEDPKRDLWKLRDAKGEWHWHPPGTDKPRFPTYFANAAWAGHMVGRWAAPIKDLGFDGIHWDTLGRVAGDYEKESAGMHEFLRTAHGLLRTTGLRQTLNFVEMSWWDREVVRKFLEFPYAEVWSPAPASKYYAEMDQPDMTGTGGVIAFYPSVAVPPGSTELDVIRTRRRESRKHRLAYLVVGDGARRMKREYWPDTVALTSEEIACLRAGAD